MAMFYLQNKGHGKAAKVVNFEAKWLNLCLFTVHCTDLSLMAYKSRTGQCISILMMQLSVYMDHIIIIQDYALLPNLKVCATLECVMRPWLV